MVLSQMKTRVSISRVRRGEAVGSALRRAVALACDAASLIRPGQFVLLKPNVFAPYPAPATTDPRVVVALVELARELRAGRVVVGEGRSISTAQYRAGEGTTRACYRSTGLEEAVRRAGAELVAFEEEEPVTVRLPAGQVLREASVPRLLLEADVLVNVPVMKIHSLTLVTLAIKNLHGLISDPDKLEGHCYREARLARKLTDLLLVRRPDLNVLDALVGQEADHATEGRPVKMGAILASRDAVALDAVAGALMGLDPAEVDTTRIAQERGLGAGRLDEIEVVGETIASLAHPFARPDLEVSPARFPGLTVCAGDYCRGCEYYIRRGLDGLKAQGLVSAERPLTLVFGRNPPLPQAVSRPVILIGDCALESPSVKPLRNRLLLEGRLRVVYACPPMEFRMRARELVEQ
jgi:uncharacterized protein (DUF362 family)